VVGFLGHQPGIPSIKLCNYEVSRDVISLVSRELAVKHEVFPLETLGRVLTLGMVCPLDRVAIWELETATNFKIRPILCLAEDIQAAINRYYASAEPATLSWLTLSNVPYVFTTTQRGD
jgi:type IV pilus assembly protein PilB